MRKKPDKSPSRQAMDEPPCQGAPSGTGPCITEIGLSECSPDGIVDEKLFTLILSWMNSWTSDRLKRL